MKALFGGILIFIFGWILQMFLPWWTIAIVCFLIAIAFFEKAKHAILLGFFSVFALWLLLAFYKSYQNDFILLERMSALLGLSSKWLLPFLSAFIGGLLGALSSLSGYYLQNINEKKARKFS